MTQRFRPNVKPLSVGRNAGFTLIEVLIGMAIIGVMFAGFITQVNIAGRDDSLKLAANQLVNSLRIAQDEAILQGRELGLRVRQHGYAYQSYDSVTEQWSDISGDKELNAKQFGDEISVELEVDQQLVVLDDQLEDQLRADEGAKNPEPQIWVLPDGGVEPEFTLRLHRDPREPAYEVKLTRVGDLKQTALDSLF